MLGIRAHSYKLTTTLNQSPNAKHEKRALEVITDCGAKKKKQMTNLGNFRFI